MQFDAMGLLQYPGIAWQGRYDEAEPIYASLYARMATFEKNLGREHPVVATAFNNWAEVLKKQVCIEYALLVVFCSWCAPLATQGEGEEADYFSLGAIEIRDKVLTVTTNSTTFPRHIPGQVRRGRAIVCQSNRYRREDFEPRSSRSCLLSPQPGGAVESPGERKTGILNSARFHVGRLCFTFVMYCCLTQAQCLSYRAGTSRLIRRTSSRKSSPIDVATGLKHII